MDERTARQRNKMRKKLSREQEAHYQRGGQPQRRPKKSNGKFSICSCVCLFVRSSVWVIVCRCDLLSVWLSVCLWDRLSVRLSVRTFVRLSVCLCDCLSVRSSVWTFMWLFVCLCDHLSMRLSVCLCDHLSVRSSVCLCCLDYSNQLAVNKCSLSLVSYFRFATRVFH